VKPALYRQPQGSRQLQAASTPHLPPAILLLVLALWLAACAQPQSATLTPTVTTTPAPTATPTRLPTVTPTPFPLGSQENPFVIAVVEITAGPQTAVAAQELAVRLAAATARSVIVRTFSDYNDLLLALEESRAHIVWLPPLTYLHASRRGLAEAALITSHFGVYQYGTQFMANTASQFTPYFDPISGLTSAGPETALPQFEGMRPCWVEPGSPSGYIVPAGLLASQGVSTTTPIFVQTHTAVIRALYIQGICDFGATFSISGDPRTSPAVLNDLPDALNRVLIIWRSDPIIPNLNLSFIAGLTRKDRQDLIDALLVINQTAEGKALLSAAAGDYQIEDLRVVEDSLYDPLRAMVDALDLDPKDFIGK